MGRRGKGDDARNGKKKKRKTKSGEMEKEGTSWRGKGEDTRISMA